MSETPPSNWWDPSRSDRPAAPLILGTIGRGKSPLPRRPATPRVQVHSSADDDRPSAPGSA